MAESSYFDAKSTDFKQFLGQYYPLDRLVDGHARAGIDKWVHGYINENRYGCKEFSERGTLNVMCLGDSFTEGYHWDRKLIFPTLLAKKLSETYGVTVGNWNMGLHGDAFDSIMRRIVHSVDFLKPDIVVAVYPTPVRRELFDEDGKMVRISVDNLKGAYAFLETGEEIGAKYFQTWPRLDSHYEDVVNVMKNCQIIEHTLNRRNIPWCYCINDFADFPDTMKLLRDKGFIGSENYLGNDFTAIDQVSKEDPHPGPKSHKLFAAQLFDWIQEKYSGRLRAIANGEGTQDHST